jgi:cell division septum initiation protein DivIVA
MQMDDLLNKLDDLVDAAWSLPGGKCVIDAEKVREIIDDLRLNLPKEIPQAKAIVADRVEILKTAKSEADDIVKNAEDKARVLVSQDEIVKKAQEKANAIIIDAKQKAKEVKMGAADFSDAILKNSEDNILAALNEIRQARQTIKAPSKL